MTLSGALPSETLPVVKSALVDAHAAAVPAGPVAIDRIALFRQETRASRFTLLESISLG